MGFKFNKCILMYMYFVNTIIKGSATDHYHSIGDSARQLFSDPIKNYSIKIHYASD